jgi:hypothetical protein
MIEQQCKHTFELKEAKKTLEYQICKKCGLVKQYKYNSNTVK